MMAGNPSWWSIHLHPPPSIFPQSVVGSPPLPDNQELPQSWSQLLLGGFTGEGERYGGPSHFQPVVEVKQEIITQHSYLYDHHANEQFQPPRPLPPTEAAWSQIMAISSSPSPRSCITSSSSNMLDFSYNNTAAAADGSKSNTSECNSKGSSTAGAWKKARVQPSSSQPPLKVRKEKLGDRITALHQLISPFGKTDTASVLLEAIGYIRFLQGQIEALSSPYLGSATPNMRKQQYVHGESSAFVEDEEQEKQEQKAKDLRSRGLCLVPVSCTQQVKSDNGCDRLSAAAFKDMFMYLVANQD
ncbi:Transcription factor bHLH68 [Hibiscus syriacus]|uniref:Transcription factor bHLH68 n=1 Tax=Hibiscus syriacus TaxID=106335 RepID=A0A6A2WQU8_HIBSY|nr:transcription factor bHLH68-like [Hibiscus syriacus]KAE8662988.1 Transcription factor bHLH68 [Hibiscus syriacus]